MREDQENVLRPWVYNPSNNAYTKMAMKACITMIYSTVASVVYTVYNYYLFKLSVKINWKCLEFYQFSLTY